MDQAKIDVLIPVFNGAQFIEESVKSIQNQTVKNIRIIIVDDGSHDDTPILLSQLARDDSRICIFRQTNAGIVEALNAGLRKCRAEFVARHDADDIAFEHRLEQQLHYLLENRAVVAVGGAAEHIDTKGNNLGTKTSLDSPTLSDPSCFPAKEPYLLHPFLMVRRAALVEVGGYRHVAHAEDSDLYWRLQEKGILHNHQIIQGQYRIHSGSVSGKSVRNGRVQAISSQMSAISALRRRAGKTDIVFSPELSTRLEAAAGKLDTLFKTVAGILTREEMRHLRLATGLKLIELAGYRPYEIDEFDCAVVSQALVEDGRGLIVRKNQQLVDRMLAGTAARLAHGGNWKATRILLRPSIAIPFAFRYFLRRCLSPQVRSHVRNYFRRS